MDDDVYVTQAKHQSNQTLTHHHCIIKMKQPNLNIMKYQKKILIPILKHLNTNNTTKATTACLQTKNNKN